MLTSVIHKGKRITSLRCPKNKLKVSSRSLVTVVETEITSTCSFNAYKALYQRKQADSASYTLMFQCY